MVAVMMKQRKLSMLKTETFQETEIESGKKTEEIEVLQETGEIEAIQEIEATRTEATLKEKILGRRSQSRGNQKTSEGFQEAGKPVPPSPKRTYHVTLKIDNHKSIFENEVVNKALVDSGCPELVAGLSWLKTYQSSRCREFRNLNRSDTFQMGETIFKTICYKLIPVKIGNHEEELEVGIIDAEIPLLISKRKLKEWG